MKTILDTMLARSAAHCYSQGSPGRHSGCCTCATCRNTGAGTPAAGRELARVVDEELRTRRRVARSTRHHRHPPPPVVRVPVQAPAPLPGNTLYLPVRLGTAGQDPVGVFIPKGFVPGAKVDFLLYLHGFKTPCGMSSTASVRTYWQDPQFLLREKVTSAGKNVILVVPTLGPKSEAGWLAQAGGFDRFWEQVLSQLTGQKALPAGTGLGTVILSGHSGAGAPIRRILQQTDKAVSAIREVWVFDGFYYGKSIGNKPGQLVHWWDNWAKNKAQVQLYSYFRENGEPGIVSLELKKLNLPNFTAIPTKANHCQIPGTFIEERIKGALFLKTI